MAYDAGHGQVVLFGGGGANGALSDPTANWGIDTMEEVFLRSSSAIRFWLIVGIGATVTGAPSFCSVCFQPR
jgi:hypothetical protein